jgi:hypothetical protein
LGHGFHVQVDTKVPKPRVPEGLIHATLRSAFHPRKPWRANDGLHVAGCKAKLHVALKLIDRDENMT